MRRNYYLGVSKRGVPIPDDPLLEGCANYEARAQLKMQYDHGEIDDDDYKRLRKEVFEKSSFSLTANAPDIIGIIMYHGNTVVMHGEDIQKYYEVSQAYTNSQGSPKEKSNSSANIALCGPYTCELRSAFRHHCQTCQTRNSERPPRTL